MSAYTVKEINEGRSMARRLQAISDDMYNSIGHTHRRLTASRLNGLSQEMQMLASSIENQTAQEQKEWEINHQTNVADATQT